MALAAEKSTDGGWHATSRLDTTSAAGVAKAMLSAEKAFDAEDGDQAVTHHVC
jgi:hypothetical protein